MIRTQVFLREDQSADIKIRSKRESKPEAEVIRELIDKGRKASAQTNQETAGQALLRLAKLGERLKLSGPTDLSSRIDDMLYGKDL
jgi:hypothetical protein